MRQAKGDLAGVAIFDRLDRELQTGTPLVETMWRKREIENYFCSEAVLLSYATANGSDDLFGLAQQQQRLERESPCRNKAGGKNWTRSLQATQARSAT